MFYMGPLFYIFTHSLMKRQKGNDEMNKETNKTLQNMLKSCAYYTAYYLTAGALDAPSSLVTGAVFFVLLKNSNPVTRILGTFATAGLMHKVKQNICEVCVEKI